ncbi:MAG: hypothetical protein FWF18_01685, partial [Dehalococcoidia bacterium]|nr:hypothetical protein [Dehalococcoidia bacterium]
EPVRDIFTFLIPFVLAPHSQKELWYGINFYYGNLEKGTYRIVTQFSESLYKVVTDPSEPGNPPIRDTASHWVYAEFEIV